MTAKYLPASIDATVDLLAGADYLADRSLGTVLFLALKMGRPIFLEGEAGVGKTETAKVLSSTLGRRLIRLQCYEGLDVAAAVYEWNYAAQMIAIRVAEAEGYRDRQARHDVFSERFLIKRPLLQALEPDTAGAPVLLIDEIDRTDEAFEAFLLEVLADFRSPSRKWARSRRRTRRSWSSPRTAPAKCTTPSSAAAFITGLAIRARTANSKSCAPRCPA